MTPEVQEFMQYKSDLLSKTMEDGIKDNQIIADFIEQEIFTPSLDAIKEFTNA